MLQLYRRYFGAINDYSRTRPNLHLQNFRVTNGELLQLLNDARLNDLFAQRDTVFSINASLGAILFNATENQYRYYHSSDNNSSLFPRPIQIRDEQSFREFLWRLRDVDFVDKACENRPDSKWVLYRVTNITLYCYLNREYPIREGRILLPPRVLTNRWIISMTRHNGVNFNDGLCAFCCIAYHQEPTMTGITERAKELERQYYDSQPYLPRDEMVVNLKNLYRLEHAFDISICVFELVGVDCKDVAIIRRRPPIVRDNTAYFHLYKNHFSYITDIDQFTQTL